MSERQYYNRGDYCPSFEKTIKKRNFLQGHLGTMISSALVLKKYFVYATESRQLAAFADDAGLLGR